MKTIVTGANGFVGRRLVELLLTQGHSVVALDVHGHAPNGTRKVVGDLADSGIRAEALSEGCDALVHLATVPGGAAEADPTASRRVNIAAMYDLLEEAAQAGTRPRVVYASSIAVLGEPLPASGVDDTTPISPKMVYGGHKAMMEIAVCLLSNRGAIDGVTVRLPGILARPKGQSGMKSAFMSDLFHALKAGDKFTCPVSEGAKIWAQSVARCADNLVHALSLDCRKLPPTRAVTLPAMHIAVADLAAEISNQCRTSADLVSYRRDPALEAAFGAYPPLATPAAERAGFAHDGTLASLVASALSTLG